MKISINAEPGDKIANVYTDDWYSAWQIETSTYLCYTEHDDVVLQLIDGKIVFVSSIDVDVIPD